MRKLELHELTGIIFLIIIVFAVPQNSNANKEVKSESPKTEQSSTNSTVKEDQNLATNVKTVANNLEIDPEDLLTVMLFETAGTLDPSIQRSDNQATGLIQFMPDTAEELNTSVSRLKNMSQAQQLEYVEKYLRKRGLPQKANIKQIYSTVFCGNPNCSGNVSDGFHTLNGAVAKMNNQHRPIARQILNKTEEIES